MPRRDVPTWKIACAAFWLAGFLLYFFSFDLPNASVSRVDVLLELLDPSPPDPRQPLSEMTRQLQAHSGWRYLPQRLDLLAVAAIILGGAWSAGHLILRLIKPSLPQRCLERTVFAYALGLSALSLLTLGLGLAAWLSRPAIGAIIAGGFIAECMLRWRERSVARAEVARIPLREESFWACSGWIAAASPFVVCMLLGALLPSTDFDVNEYHFQGPKEYFQNGRITFLPHNVDTSFPFCTEMLTLLGMVLRQDWYCGALAGKAALACFAPLTGLALFAAGRRWFGTTAGLAAALIHLSTPWIYRISIIAYAEGGLTFYLFACLSAVLIWLEPPQAVEAHPGETTHAGPAWAPRSTRQALLAGLLAGSAMACKYPGLISVVLPLGAVLLLADRLHVRRLASAGSAASPTLLRPVSWRSAAAFCIGVGLAVGPWLLKNVAETGNPVYPLMYRVFGGIDWDLELNEKWRRGHRPDNYDLGNLGASLVDVSARSDWLSPLLFGLAPLALLRSDVRKRVRWLWIYLGYLFLSWWLLTHRIDRFWVPQIPVVSLLAGVGATWLTQQAAARRPAELFWKGTLGLCLITTCLFNLGFVMTPLCGYNDYLLDLNRARLFAARITAPEVQYLNERLPAGSRVLCVGEAQVFDAEFPLIYNTVFDRSIFEQWCASPIRGVSPAKWPLLDRAAIRKTLQTQGITHLFVNWREILRYRTTYGYTEFVSPDRFEELQRMGLIGPPWEIPSAYEDVAVLAPSWKHAVGTWGQALQSRRADRTVIATFQVFPVLYPDCD